MNLEAIQFKTSDGKIIKLTVEEALELRKQLNGVFGRPKAPDVKPIVIEKLVPRERSPLYPYRQSIPQIWCGVDMAKKSDQYARFASMMTSKEDK